MKTETYTYRVPACMNVALLYGDTSGFSEADAATLKAIEREAEKRARFLSASHYCWQIEPQEPEFCVNPDFGMPADCLEVSLVLFGKEAA